MIQCITGEDKRSEFETKSPVSTAEIKRLALPEETKRCNYPTNNCPNPRTHKPNGELHHLCEHHRQRQNTTQRKYSSRKRLRQARKKNTLPALHHIMQQNRHLLHAADVPPVRSEGKPPIIPRISTSSADIERIKRRESIKQAIRRRCAQPEQNIQNIAVRSLLSMTKSFVSKSN